MNRCRTFFLLSAIFLTLLLSACGDSPRSQTTFIDDQPSLLSEIQQARIRAYHQRLLTDLDIHLQVTILDAAAPDIDRRAVELFDAYRLGEATRAARGLLLLVDPKGRQVRLEVGYDLEPVFTDLLVSRVEREQMIPFFRANRVGDGLEATVELLVAAALEDTKGSVAGGGELVPLSGGGGAKVAVEIGSGAAPKDAVDASEDYAPGGSPADTLRTYAEVLSLRIKDPDLPIYTPATREFFQQWLVTDGQQASELKSVSAALEVGELLLNDRYAVLRCPPGMRAHAPYLLQLSPQGWQLDFVTMSQVIGFNHRNQWFFRNHEHPYRFAFTDWTFDQHGFPKK